MVHYLTKRFPQIVWFGRVRCYVNTFTVVQGVGEREGPCVKAYAASLFTAFRSVFKVSLDVQAGGGELRSYLVMPARKQLYFYKKVVCTFACYPVAENRFLSSGAAFVICKRFVFGGAGFYPVDEFSAFAQAERRLFNNRPVDFFDREGQGVFSGEGGV